MTSLEPDHKEPLTPGEQRIWDDTVVAIVSRHPWSSADQLTYAREYGYREANCTAQRQFVYESAIFIADELIAYMRKRT